MKVVSVINYKGGVGKTSLTANLGAELAWRGLRVLMIDLDAQASLTFSFISADDWSTKYAADRTIKAWFDGFDGSERIDLQSIVEKPQRVNARLSGRGSLDVIYSHLGLINVDLELATQIGGASLSQARRNFLSVHRRLLVGLNAPALQDSFDLCLIDCPPNFNIVTKTAIVASEHILVPTKPDQLSTLGIDYLRRSIRRLVDDYNDFVDLEQGHKEKRIKPRIAGVVFTMIQEYGGVPISAQRAYMRKISEDSGLRVFGSYITRNESMFAGAPEYGVPVVLTGTSNYSHQKVIDGIEQVATEFMGGGRAQRMKKQQITSTFLRALADAMDALSPEEFQVVLDAAGLKNLLPREHAGGRAAPPRPGTEERAEALIRGLSAMPTRDAAREFLQGSEATKAILLAAARSRDVHVLKQDNISTLTDKLIASTVGARLDSAAIRNG